MADLGRLFGTEEDKVNCAFFFKIGACRHGNRCSRVHVRPNISQTVLIPHMYQPPPECMPTPQGPAAKDDTEEFADFVDEVLGELHKFGQVEELNVCQNLGDHMFGNVYVKFVKEDAAEKAFRALQGRYYAGQLLEVEYSPVTDFQKSRCRQFDDRSCARGGFCNYMHVKPTPEHLREHFNQVKYKARSAMNRNRGRRERSSSRGRGRDPKQHDELYLRTHSVERRRVIEGWNKDREEELRLKHEARR